MVFRLGDAWIDAPGLVEIFGEFRLVVYSQSFDSCAMVGHVEISAYGS